MKTEFVPVYVRACVRANLPLMLLLERRHLCQLLSLATDLTLLPVDDFPVLAQLVLPARTLVLQTFQLQDSGGPN